MLCHERSYPHNTEAQTEKVNLAGIWPYYTFSAGIHGITVEIRQWINPSRKK